MVAKYVCRHCHTIVGELSQHGVSERLLGLHFLTPEERQSIISYNRYGDLTVKVICDYCKEALEHNPELALVGNPLQ